MLRKGLPRVVLRLLTLDMLARLWDHLVVILRHQDVCCNRDAETVEQKDDPTDRAKNEGLVQCPADEEAVIVIVKVGLTVNVSTELPTQTYTCTLFVDCLPPKS